MLGWRGLEAAIRILANCPSDQRLALLEERLQQQPGCPVARYLYGCHCFDSRQPAQAVRQMMVAAHAEPDFQSASLLVFAGLNLVGRRGEPLLRVLIETWDEFRRPAFDRTARERLFLDAFAEPCPDWPGHTLARQLWRLPIPQLRTQLSAAMRSAGAERHPLLAGAL